MRPEVTEELLAEARGFVDLFELEYGRPPDSLAELEEIGTAWTVLDKKTGLILFSSQRRYPDMTLQKLDCDLWPIYGYNIIEAILEAQGRSKRAS